MGEQVPLDTQILSADAPGAIERAIEILASGRPIAFPTDTVYGVGAHALLPEAVARLFSVKERPLGLAVPLLLADAACMDAVCLDIPPVAWDLARRFWPGALSLILHRAPVVPEVVAAGGPTVAVRVPDHVLVRTICRRLGAPLAATSANLHGLPDAVTAQAACAYLKGHIPLVLDGGPSHGGVASTLLDLTVVPPAIRRRGPVTVEQIAALVSDLA